jgi:hypothetical protein
MVRVLDPDPSAWKGSSEGVAKVSAALLEKLRLTKASCDLMDLNAHVVVGLRQLDKRVSFGLAPGDLISGRLVRVCDDRILR